MTEYLAQIETEDYALSIDRTDQVSLNGVPCDVQLEEIDGQSLFVLIWGAKSYEVIVEPENDTYQVTIEGQRYTVRVKKAHPSLSGESAGEQREAARTLGSGPPTEPGPQAGAGAVVSPMTGVLIEILHGEGEKVEAGQEIAILEAMKTENVIRAPRSGIVRDVRVAPGQTVRMDDIIMHIAAPET